MSEKTKAQCGREALIEHLRASGTGTSKLDVAAVADLGDAQTEVEGMLATIDHMKACGVPAGTLAKALAFAGADRPSVVVVVNEKEGMVRWYHESDGLYFERYLDGSVGICKTDGRRPEEGGKVVLHQILPEAVWASAVSSMTAADEATNYELCRKLHMGDIEVLDRAEHEKIVKDLQASLSSALDVRDGLKKQLADVRKENADLKKENVALKKGRKQDEGKGSDPPAGDTPPAPPVSSEPSPN